MIKSLFAAISFIGFLLVGYFFAADVVVTQDLPDQLAPGESKEVTVQFQKTGVTGFAKYQITVAEGLSIDVVESAGASFTFNNQQAKFIWMSLPSADSFSITYRITAQPNASGSLSVSSRFSYIKENERRNFDLDDSAISITGTAAAEPDLAEDSKQSTNESATASGQRTIYNLGHNQYRVDITLHKSELSGFAKIEETIPPKFSAINLESRSAVFSVAGPTVKFIWFDIPAEDSLTISYKLLPEDPEAYSDMDISGAFSFLQNEVTITIPIESTSADPLAAIAEQDGKISDPNIRPKDSDRTVTKTEDMRPILTDTATIAEQFENQPTTDQEAEPTLTKPAENNPTPKTETQQPVAKQEAKTTRGNVSGNIANVPDPEEGVYYRVQVAAGKNNLSTEVFAKMYHFNEGLKLEHHKSWYKYTTGYHEVYKSARNDRERIKSLYSKFQGPFVTAYNDGERITVQEALILTEQKWVP